VALPGRARRGSRDLEDQRHDGEGRPAGVPRAGDLASFAGRTVRRGQLTPPGDRYLRERLIAENRVVTWENEGQKLEAIVTIPPPGVASAPYKILVYPHGGPHGRSTLGFNLFTQIFAARGYLVFEPNFRGSAGYGQKFIDADRRDFGGGDMRDILSGVDHLVRQKLADPERQFVYGSSYGGFMTSWLVGHTKQFKAAAMQNAVTDLNAMWGLSDLQSWTEWEFRRPSLGNARAHAQAQPDRLHRPGRTPTLVLHAREDRRCPLPMGLMFYRSLERAGCRPRWWSTPGKGIRSSSRGTARICSAHPRVVRTSRQMISPALCGCAGSGRGP
jgi:dipeptidyl aminopeptidase/acylaminoacyl peptidase